MGTPASKIEKASDVKTLVHILQHTKWDKGFGFRLLKKQSHVKTFAFESDWNEVYDNVIISSDEFAKTAPSLSEVGVTHVLNVAEGTTFAHCKPHHRRYEKSAKTINCTEVGIVYKGVRANDTFVYNLRQHFEECSNFIDGAVKNGGKVLVHCLMGYSRSPAIVAAYLMSKQGMSAQQALKTIRSRREIFPNQGFLQQLCDHEEELRDKGILPPVLLVDTQINRRASSGSQNLSKENTNFESSTPL